MPAFETMDLEQVAVLWGKSGTDDYGQPTTATAIEIPVRWLTKRDEVVDAQGNTIALDATVVVERQIAVGSLMALGNLSYWVGTGSAGDESEVMEVVTYEETPDLKGREIRRSVGLKRFRDALPESV